MKTRLRIFSAIFAAAIVGLIVRLFFWQVTNASELAKQGQLQYQRSSNITSMRGNIYATDGSYLTTDEKDWILFATKSDFKETKRVIANKLSPIINIDASKIEGILDKNSVWIPIQHKVSNSIKKNIEALGIAGIGFDPEPTRVYPEGSSSAHILGFVGKDSAGNEQGYFGLEGFYDLTLAGKPGFVNQESAANGTPILFGNSKQVGASSGIDLLTNIDKTVQLIIEKELKSGLELYGAKSGTIMVMDPKSGTILAIASSPSFDPANYWKYTNTDFKNPTISDTFEPGSIFKPIIMAAALDAGVIKPDTKCDICDKAIKVDDYQIETWNNQYHPNSTMTDVIVNSDNVGMTYVGRKLGADKIYDYLQSFGIGRLTGIDLQGEATSSLRKKGTWSSIDTATTTFGQGIAVTPIQVLRAIAIIANGGNFVKPQIVRQIKNGEWESNIKPQIGPRVISQKAANEARDMMVRAVVDGEAKWAAPHGFSIAGKTGTAQIPLSGHYDATKTNASFVGFAPANNPRFVMLVTLQNPTSSPWAAETAAPLWFNIAKELFPYLGIGPEN
jgi:cell division protein FtsI/penicillin-binding protein 2